MSNNIDTMTQQYLQLAGRPAEANAPAKSPDASEASVPAGQKLAQTDTVELTDSARQLQALENQVAGLGEVDHNRVEAVRSRLEAGTYEVSSQRIADKMLAMDRALPGDK